MRILVTAETVAAAFARGQRVVAAPKGRAIITPAAWTRAHELGVELDQRESATVAAVPAAAADAGRCERVVDPSGAIVVRGKSVELGQFSGARGIGLTDVITGKDSSPMTAGFMAWAHADSFPWKLDYDEVDYVLEGVLHVTLDGRVLEGKPGDVLYLPKGSQVVFGTPTRTRVFYVTYPAEWQGPKK